MGFRISQLVAGSTLLFAFGSPAWATGLLSTNGQVIAANGMPVPGYTDVFFGGASTFDSPVIDESGSVLFRSRMVGNGITALNERALFRGPSYASLSMMIRGSDAAPGLPGLTLNTATASGIGGGYRQSGDGRTLWGSSLSGPGVTTGVNDTALFGGYAGSLGVIARRGDAAPGTVGATLNSSFSAPSQQNTGMNRNGHVLFQAALTGGDTVTANNAAWYEGTPGALNMVVRKGDNMGGGATVSNMGFVSQMNRNNQVLWQPTLGGTATTADDAAMFVYTPGSGNALLMREGQVAPGTAGATYSGSINVAANAFNNSGKALFTMALAGGDVVAGVNDAAMFAGTTSGVNMVVRKGAAAPGTDSTFGVFSNSSVSLSDNDFVVTQASLIGGSALATTDTGIWSGPIGGSLSLVAREGDVAPGTAGAVFNNMTGNFIQSNSVGQVLFQSNFVTGTGDATTANDSALYAWDPFGGLTLVAREGDTVQVGPGDIRTITSWGGVQFTNGDSDSLSFTADGTLTLRVSFADTTSGIMTVRIPEPASLLLLVLGGLFVRRR